MDVNHTPDNFIENLLDGHTALSGAVFGVRAQQEQQEQQQQQMLPAQRFLEVGTS